MNTFAMRNNFQKVLYFITILWLVHAIKFHKYVNLGVY